MTAKDDLVKEAIVNAAARVFQKWGLNKTTMEDIAHEAGKGKSTLYYYYPSKEEIFETVVIAEFEGVLDRAKAATRDLIGAKEKLRAYIVASMMGMKKSTNVYSIVRGEVKGDAVFINKFLKYFEAKEVVFIREILTLGVANQEFSFTDEAELEAAAHVVVGLLRAMDLYLFLENDDTTSVNIAAKLIANGI